MKQLEAEELRSCLPGGRTLFTYGKDWYAAFVLRYLNDRLRLSRQWWDEAMLSAAVDFIVNELGLRTIYDQSQTWEALQIHLDDARIPVLEST